MEFSSLFNYPGTESNNKPEELIFLAKQSAEEWSTILDYTEIYIFKRGEVVIHKGDTSRVLYIVKNGSLEVFIPQKNNFSGKEFEPDSPDDIVITIEDSDSNKYKKLVISQNKIVGAILIGYPIEGPLVTKAVKSESNISSIISSLRNGSWNELSKLVD